LQFLVRAAHQIGGAEKPFALMGRSDTEIKRRNINRARALP